MFAIIGVAVVLVCVFGGYTLAGGKLSIVLHALPFEFMIIGGAAAGSLLVANSLGVVKKALGGFGKVLRGPKWTSQDYRDLLCLLFALARVHKQKGNLGLEAHIEQPNESAIFTQYPKIMRDEFAVTLICDTVRMMTLNLEDPHQVDDYLDAQLEKRHQEVLEPANALTTVADALPALGIVAAVLGVIKTMASINEPPEVLGKLIASALVGTFLGVFLSYGVVGPFANRMKQVSEEEMRFYHVIKDVLVGMAHGHAPQVAIEVGRGNVPSPVQPSFYDIDEAVNELPREAA